MHTRAHASQQEISLQWEAHVVQWRPSAAKNEVKNNFLKKQAPLEFCYETKIFKDIKLINNYYITLTLS